MSLCKRSNTWWIRLTHCGQRIQKSTGTSDKAAAQRFHDEFKAKLWKEDYLKEKRKRTWPEAVMRWLSESAHKRSLSDDKCHLKWLDSYLEHLTLNEITRDLISKLADLRLGERQRENAKKKGVTPATVNRMLEIIRAILRKAEREWEWIERAPVIRMLHEDNRRIRWITKEVAALLLKELPSHLAAMAAFSLATGLRQKNVMRLEWDQVDLIRKHALIHADQAKGKKPIPVPLNSEAILILQQQQDKHKKFVFTYQNMPVTQCNTKAWQKALKRAKIDNFRWHDLRHTWASWHVQNGTSLQELQQLGGWSSFEMVLRYAHLSSDHLKEAAERVTMESRNESKMQVSRKSGSKKRGQKISGTNLVHLKKVA